jgi:hypothetical protein
MTPRATQFDGIAMSTVSGKGGRTCTVPAGASGTASAFSITMVDAGKARPASASHFTAGEIVTLSALAALDPMTIVAPARRDVTAIWIVFRCIASSVAHESS